MIREGERSGALQPGRTLLDATSGNTGIAYAMLGASRGYRVRLCVPSNVSRERKQLLYAYGAELVLTDPMDGSDGAIREARRIHAAAPQEYFYPDQYSNPANWRAHYDGDRRRDHRTDRGTRHPFRRRARHERHVRRHGTPAARVERPSVTLISVQPQSPLHGLEGLKHMESAIVPAIYDPTLADRDERVTTEEAYRLVLRLAREEGVLVGPSGGAALAASLRVADQIERGIIVTVFPDGGDRYLSERFWTGAMTGTTGTAEKGLSLTIPAAAFEIICGHGAETYPDECCGALLGPRTGRYRRGVRAPE